MEIQTRKSDNLKDDVFSPRYMTSLQSNLFTALFVVGFLFVYGRGGGGGGGGGIWKTNERLENSSNYNYGGSCNPPPPPRASAVP